MNYYKSDTSAIAQVRCYIGGVGTRLSSSIIACFELMLVSPVPHFFAVIIRLDILNFFLLILGLILHWYELIIIITSYSGNRRRRQRQRLFIQSSLKVSHSREHKNFSILADLALFFMVHYYKSRHLLRSNLQLICSKHPFCYGFVTNLFREYKSRSYILATDFSYNI